MSARRIRTAATVLAVAAALALAGCTPSPSPSPSATGIGIPCDELVSPSVITAVKKGLEPTNKIEVPGDSSAKTIRSLGGTVCDWVVSIGDGNSASVTVAVVKLSKAQQAKYEAKVKAGSTSTIDFGSKPAIRGYEANTGGTYSGDMEVFTEDGYWIAALSPLFLSPSYAESVIASVLQAIPSG
jgi:hypothetical protein